MRPVALAILLALLAGCAAPATPTPTTTPAPEGPIDLTGKLGLFALDVDTGAVEKLSDTSALAWVSPNGSRVFWNEATFGVLLDATTGGRDVTATGRWARLYDNGTGLELLDGTAAWRDARAPNASATADLPPAPLQGARWTQASDDLRVLGGEYEGPTFCGNDIFLRADQSARSRGCHLRVAADGRAGWTELGRIRVREPGQEIETLEPANGTSSENPIFVDGGHVFLRLHGPQPTRTEVVGADGEVLATAASPTRLALHDATADGHLILLSAFR